MHINDFDYKLPEELIAQKPQKDRDKCRLMVLRRSDNSIEHRHFFDILEYLKEGDCLLLNDSKVIPARLYGIKEGTGARVEFLLIKRIEGDTWETMVRPGKRLKPGDSVVFSDEDGKKLRAKILDYGEDGTRIVKMEYDGILMERLEEIGSMPLPPYISRPSNDEDKDDYQTVYCHEEGSVAAPTAGLHFTTELLEKARENGVKIAFVTLHVGIGTFRPVKCETIENHHMHFEEYSVSEETAEIVNETVLSGGRVISVGTTSTRTAESAACFDEKSGKYLLKAGSGSTDIFIYPGYEFKIIESLITNFHLPKSTLMMLVSALYDREHILKAYDEAVREEYRFFSYGDAMFIE
ncbi:MAG: tRNA preQ1(34) S-adenosylmethionine ribosyltransferase-isomerase QueA [Mogibacterium diversum]|uniref:tRNA preQ1(34) S-adenosylmethionine ribosyltransferase-isomerase QueA n=1 Tax=Mogibacterium diversum TaxID=114527 RepID=UPI001CB5FB64|nr:tRNA preQ1(34) S-adenosylmethionine ribosyltransferase-isomerase QueA [Mogibacterium diversum]MBF1340525.1 tRNA preQ1(34) S-adenosylmethionine ribosyltransferase-isomerase QueA [Mogibacterium diversum]